MKLFKSETTMYYLMMLPFGLLFIGFVLAPIAVSVFLSFTDFNMVRMPRLVGFDNYLRMFTDDSVFIIALRNTLLFALVTGPVSYAACLLLAWLVNELDGRLHPLFTFLLYVPAMSGAAFMVWAFLFSGDQYGLLNSVIIGLGFADEPVQWLSDTRYVMGCVIAVQLWLSLGTAFLSFIAGFKGVDRQQYEAAAVDGITNRLQELWLITLPNMRPQLLFGAVMQIGASFAAGDVGVALLKESGQSGIATDYAATTIVTYMREMGTERSEMGYACALAVLLFLLMVVFNAVIRRALLRNSD